MGLGMPGCAPREATSEEAMAALLWEDRSAG